MTGRLSAPCFALLLMLGSERASASDSDCADPVDQTTMTMCAEQALQAADAELGATYVALIETVSPQGREKLEAAWRAWIAYRDAQCDFATFGARGGSIHSMLQSTCRTGLAQAQTQLLKDQLDCEEGDLSCGHQ